MPGLDPQNPKRTHLDLSDVAMSHSSEFIHQTSCAKASSCFLIPSASNRWKKFGNTVIFYLSNLPLSPANPDIVQDHKRRRNRKEKGSEDDDRSRVRRSRHPTTLPGKDKGSRWGEAETVRRRRHGSRRVGFIRWHIHFQGAHNHHQLFTSPFLGLWNMDEKLSSGQGTGRGMVATPYENQEQQNQHRCLSAKKQPSPFHSLHLSQSPSFPSHVLPFQLPRTPEPKETPAAPESDPN